MKLNELVCPRCGLRCMTERAYTVCDACGTYFTASQSKTCELLPADNTVYIVQPLPMPFMPWSPSTGPIYESGMTTYQVDCQVWN